MLVTLVKPDSVEATKNSTMDERPATRSLVSTAEEIETTPSKRLGRRLEDRQFSMMASRFTPTGGMLRSDDVARLLRRHHDRPLSVLDRWIASREVVSVTYGGQTRLPLFQFEQPVVAPHPNLLPVLQELHPAFDDWELATWFASPSEWLAGRAPVDVFATCPSSVLNAARADRYIAMG